MKRDPNKVEDASGDRTTNWDREIAAGHVVPVTGMVRDTSDPGMMHVQGVPLTDEEARRRVVPASVLKESIEQAQAGGGRAFTPPSRSTGKSSFGPPPGGWPQFGKEQRS